MSLKLKCLSNLYVTKTGISLKLDCHSNWNVTQIGMSHKLVFTQIEFSLKLECHSNMNVTQIGRLNGTVVNPKTSYSASIGQISILFFLLLAMKNLGK